MEKDFVVFWRVGCAGIQQSIVRVSHPPHDEPRGSMLRDILAEGLPAPGDVLGAVALPPSSWSNNQTLELATFDGRIASVECTGGAWRVVA